MKYEDSEKNVRIVAKEINIDEDVEFGKDISVMVKGEFRIGSYSRLGDNTQIRGNNVVFGKHLFNTSGLRIGGGGRQHPTANLKIGMRCTIHNNIINICEPVEIGDDVGLSSEVAIITHGYWLSVFEGFPASFSGVKIGNGVIVGYRSVILMGVTIADFAVIGANSTVVHSLLNKGVYVGSPARLIREIVPLTSVQREVKLDEIIVKYLQIAKYHGFSPKIKASYPFVRLNGFRVNVETFEFEGMEDEETDDFRDYIRKWGIRVYTKRPFRSKFAFE